jgi:hypothetical protein
MDLLGDLFTDITKQNPSTTTEVFPNFLSDLVHVILWKQLAVSSSGCQPKSGRSSGGVATFKPLDWLYAPELPQALT